MSEGTVIRFFERRFGAPSFVVTPGSGILRWKHVSIRAIRPLGDRRHWILFTVGMSRTRIASCDDEESGRVELMMSLHGTWRPFHAMPSRLFHGLAVGVRQNDWPIDDLPIYNDITTDAPPGRIFCMALAPSRQLAPPARIQGAIGRGRTAESAEIFAAYGLTLAQHDRFRRDRGAIEDIPEVIERWHDMLRPF